MLQALVFAMVTLVPISDGARAEHEDTRPCVKKIRVGQESVEKKHISLEQFDHSSFDALLHKYVTCEGWVCYEKWKCNCDDRQALYDYLVSLGDADHTLPASKQAKLAYFTNSYNALVIYGVLQFYPTPSIQKHNAKDAQFRIFDDLEVWIDGEYMSLNTIEHDVLRPMRDPRIHFALVCAARGCPKLRQEAYVADRLDEQFTDNAVDFFSHPNRFQTCKLTGTVKLSPILLWFKEDFGTTDQNIIATILPFVPCKDREWLEKHPCAKIKYMGYNWGINDDCASVALQVKVIPYAMYSKFEPYVRPFRTQNEVPSIGPEEDASKSKGEATPEDKKIKKIDPLSMSDELPRKSKFPNIDPLSEYGGQCKEVPVVWKFKEMDVLGSEPVLTRRVARVKSQAHLQEKIEPGFAEESRDWSNGVPPSHICTSKEGGLR